jgi:hypothetical protein
MLSSGSAGLWGRLAWAVTGLAVLVKGSCGVCMEQLLSQRSLQMGTTRLGVKGHTDTGVTQPTITHRQHAARTAAVTR